MTVSKITPVNNYSGNGSTTTFDFDFLIENESELRVQYTNSLGSQTDLVLNVDYTIHEVGNEDGSYIEYPKSGSTHTVLTSDEIITLSLDLDIEQEKEFKNSSKLNLITLEWTLDYITRLIQIANRKIERSVKIQEGSSTTPDELIAALYESATNAAESAASAAGSADAASGFADDASDSASAASGFADDAEDSYERTAAKEGVIADLVTEKEAEITNLTNTKKGEITATGNAEVERIIRYGYRPHDLFDFKRTDHLINNLSWLRADTFSWQNGVTYEQAYNELLSEYNDASSTDELDTYNKQIIKVGTLTDNDGVISGFSTSNYCELPKLFNPNTNTWEIVECIKLTNFSETCDIFSSVAANDYGIHLQIQTDGKIHIYLSSNGTSQNIASNVAGTSILSTDTKYYIKAVFTGSAYVVYSSTTGDFTGEEITEITISSTSALCSMSQSILGRNANPSYPQPLNGSIDLKESYIKINNELWWKGCEYVNYKRTPKGYKIVTADQEAAVLTKYNDLGISWYYVLDTINTQFKLPRTKFGFEGLRGYVGDDIEAGSPNIYGTVGTCVNYAKRNGAITTTTNGQYKVDHQQGSNVNVALGNLSLNASYSSLVYGNSDTVQEPATQTYLYFYIGEYTESAIEQTAGLNSELFNGKADISLNNLSNGLANTICTTTPTTTSSASSARPAVVIENYVNGTSWYRVYSDKWCEQGGVLDFGSDQTSNAGWNITLLKRMANTNYSVMACSGGNSSNGGYGNYIAVSNVGKTTTTISGHDWKTETSFRYINWEVKGYIN